MSPDDLLPNVRTQLFSGESPEQVYEYLQANGLDDEQAKSLIKLVQCERSDEIRAMGIGKIIYGLIFGVLAGIAWLVDLSFPSKWWLMREDFYIFAIAAVLTLFSFWRVALGLKMLLMPKTEKGDVSKLTE
jgi:hypothetical protein